MAFSDFTLSDLHKKFGVTDKVEKLFEKLELINPSSRLIDDLEESMTLTPISEKEKSEAIIFPILKEIRRINQRSFKIFSGRVLNGKKEEGLYGECDFIFSKSVDSFELKSPLFIILEAKRGDIDEGVSQCSAQLLGAKFFNELENENIDTIYGCVTNADVWRFIRFKDNIITIDKDKYHYDNLPLLMGVFQKILDTYK